MNKILNFKSSPKDERDYIAKPSTIKLNATNDLSSFCTSVKDQESLGSCTAFSCVAMIEYFLKKNGIIINDDLLSELFLYYNTRVLIENESPSSDCGAYLRDVLKAMNRYGVCLEKSFPYGSNCALVPNKSCYTEGSKYQVVKYANIPTRNVNTALNDLKALIQSGNTFVGGIMCYSNFFNDTKGTIPLPTGTIIGGHAVLFVGYDDTKRVFKFKNSWGKNWGDKGYGYLPYTYLLNGSLVDLWTIYGQEYNDKVVGSAGSVIPPSLRLQANKDMLNYVMSAISEYDDDSGSPSILIQNKMKNLRDRIKINENNFLLTSSDILEFLTLVDRLENTLKFTAKNLKI